MFNEKTESKVEELIRLELEEAMRYGDKYASSHEGWAILKEEIEEAKECFEIIEESLDFLWNCVKDPNCYDGISQNGWLKDIEKYAKEGIKELAQVCAVCEKFRASNSEVEE